MISLAEELRFGLRLLRRNPGFTVAAVLTLALGISTNTVVFNVVYGVLMRPLHFPDAGRLVVILSTAPGVSQPFTSAPGVFVDWRERATSFDAVAGVRARRMVLSGVDEPRFVSVAAASSDFFSLIGIEAQLGRMFATDEDQPGKDTVAVVDAGFRDREFGGNVNVLKTAARLLFGPADPIGRHLRTNDRDRKSLEVIGVVGDARQIGLTKEPGPQIYLPLKYGNAGFVIARTAANAGNLSAAILTAVFALDPSIPAPEIDTMRAAFSRETATPRFHLMVLGAFAMAS